MLPTWVDITPTLICFCKALANGYNVSALCGKDFLKNTISGLSYTGSYWLSAVPFAAGIACIEKMKKLGMPELLIYKGTLVKNGLIAAAQKVEHYEIASYGTLLALARQLDFGNIEGLLQETLAEEKAADQKLTQLAEGGANQAAAQAESGSQARSDRKNNA